MKRWIFKSEQEPDCVLSIESMNYEGAYSKLRFLTIKPDLWELDEMVKLDH